MKKDYSGIGSILGFLLGGGIGDFYLIVQD